MEKCWNEGRERAIFIAGTPSTPEGKMRRSALRATLALFVASVLPAQDRRSLTVNDIFELKNVGDPRVSPNGDWVA